MIKAVKKAWGLEKWLVNDEKYCVKELGLYVGKKSSYHFHPLKRETFVPFLGRMILEIEGEPQIFFANAVTIEPGVKHRFYNPFNSACIFYECSTYHDDADVVRLTESGDL